MVRIISWAPFSRPCTLTICALLLSGPLKGREYFDFSIGDNIHVISDKAFRHSQENEFTAVGNVIITHQKNAIYGEKAKIQFDPGEVLVEGNVRYVSSAMTLYGSQLQYNFRSKFFKLKNARILSDHYIIVGESFSRSTDGEVVCLNAEYTTCRDCPESWSIFGRSIRVALKKYVYIKHAYIKIKGVVVMYVPYIVLPIKQNRESGLLFPKFSWNLKEGLQYRQGWFWAISPSADLTLTPTAFFKRGQGNEFQFRHTPRDGLWYEFNSLHLKDRIYSPGKKDYEFSGGSTFRHLSEWEHHFHSAKNWNHHFYYNIGRDLDTHRGLERFATDRLQGSELGGGGFIDFRNNWLGLGIESSFKRNQLYRDPRGFDHRYVQVLPEVSFNLIPYRLFQSKVPLLHNVTFDFKGKSTVFKQNHREEGKFIRNATRHNLTPQLTWSWGRWGPLMGKTSALFDYQHYRFPYEREERSFTKKGVIHETEFMVELEKIFGLAYGKEIPSSRVLQGDSPSKKKKPPFTDSGDYMGGLPSATPQVGKKNIILENYAYRHTQQLKFKHYFLRDQKSEGNQRFLDQIRLETGEGQFDPIDAIREKEFQLTNEVSRTSLPLNNTVEFQWNNSLVRKRAVAPHLRRGGSLRDHFVYEKISFFNLSQGYDFNIRSPQFKDHLTRLFVYGGINLSGFSSSIQEYYYYTTREHLLTVDLKKSFGRGDISSSFKYNTFKNQGETILALGGGFHFNDQLHFRAFGNYDYQEKRVNSTGYEVFYSPPNNCWRFMFKYEKKIEEVKLDFGFSINFNKNNFISF